MLNLVSNNYLSSLVGGQAETGKSVDAVIGSLVSGDTSSVKSGSSVSDIYDSLELSPEAQKIVDQFSQSLNQVSELLGGNNAKDNGILADAYANIIKAAVKGASERTAEVTQAPEPSALQQAVQSYQSNVNIVV